MSPVAVSANANALPDPDPSAVYSTKAIVLDSKTKSPLAGVTVYVKNLSDNSVTKTKTDSRGAVMIPYQSNTDYEIVVEKSGYKKMETKSNLSQSQLYFSLSKEEAMIHPFIRFK